MNSIKDLEWEIVELERGVERFSKQFEPIKYRIWEIEDFVVETGKYIKEVQKRLVKSKDMLDDLARQTEHNR